ncbi:S-layer protein, partial [human gut metagenome]
VLICWKMCVVNIRCMLINSVVVDDRLISEFGPEMVLFRVDTIAKNHEEQPTIERIRINKK